MTENMQWEERTQVIRKGLAAEFAQDMISWRAQTVYNNKALALAYIDARDVAQRLDDVTGINGWQDSYLDSGKRTYCTIKIFFGISNEWISKSDAAGDSDVEAEKGAVSDAFKRAAVKWGIGRYLYDDRFKGVWVPCETQEKNGKQMFKKFADDPWKFVKGGSTQPQNQPAANPEPKQEVTPEERERLRVRTACFNWFEKLKTAKLPANDLVKKFSEFKEATNTKGENMWKLANSVYPDIGKELFEKIDQLTKEVK